VRAKERISEAGFSFETATSRIGLVMLWEVVVEEMREVMEERFEVRVEARVEEMGMRISWSVEVDGSADMFG